MHKTVLYPVHLELGAKMTPFGGWHMPLSYSSIREEHHAVRRCAGLFDLGHMGRFAIRGPERMRLLEYVATNRFADLPPGRARYALFCAEDGGVIDDVIAYVLPDRLFVVVNAANRETDLAAIERARDALGLDAEIEDRSEALGMIALQGPKSREILEPLLTDTLEDLAYYGILDTRTDDTDLLVARTGYTGEDGFEIYLPREATEALWRRLLERGRPHGLLPCGLGARDTLRLEAAMPLYGHELSREINPFEAGLGFAVKLDKPDFMGKEALMRIRSEGPRRKLACLRARGRRIPRQGQRVLSGEQPIGAVTSGSYAPTLECPIAMALIDPAYAEVGRELTIDVRGRALEANVVKRPFYKRETKP